MGQHLVGLLDPWHEGGRAAAIDSTPLRTRGGVWHRKDREAGVVPHSSIDTEAHWTKSGWQGWVYGWKLHLVITVAAVWLRFVTGRPVSALTTQFLAWCAERLAAAGKTALLLVWDNAPWYISQHVRGWLRTHNRQVRKTGQGVRIISCLLPTKSPWLNNSEPHWVHSKRKVAEPDRLLSARELAERVCTYFDCPYEEHLCLPDKIA